MTMSSPENTLLMVLEFRLFRKRSLVSFSLFLRKWDAFFLVGKVKRNWIILIFVILKK
jgi:hypothetical protein